MNEPTWGERALAIAQEVLNESRLTDNQLWAIMLNETGFPCFFDGDPATELRRQLEEYKRDGPIVDIETGRRERR